MTQSFKMKKIWYNSPEKILGPIPSRRVFRGIEFMCTDWFKSQRYTEFEIWTKCFYCDFRLSALSKLVRTSDLSIISKASIRLSRLPVAASDLLSGDSKEEKYDGMNTICIQLRDKFANLWGSFTKYQGRRIIQSWGCGKMEYGCVWKTLVVGVEGWTSLQIESPYQNWMQVSPTARSWSRSAK